jgi:hypothetical protein
MDQIRDMIKHMIAEEAAQLRPRADPVAEARMLLEAEIAKATARQATMQGGQSNEAPSGSDGPVDGGYRRAYGGTSQGLSMLTGKDFGHTATMGNAKFTVAMPPKFNPDVNTWMLWKPQAMNYFDMIGLEGVLDAVKGHTYDLQTNRYVIGALQQISPEQDAAWMSTLQLKFAYQAWEQLEKAYGSRAELDMQKKLFEFESSAQRATESVREWTIRLERQVTELNVMSKEAAKENVMGYNEQRDTAVYESTHKFRLLNVRIDNQPHEAFIATLRCQIYSMSVKDVETALISYEQGRQVQQALNSAAGGSVSNVYNTYTGGAGGAYKCYACDGTGHHWQECQQSLTPSGRSKLLARNIRVPYGFTVRTPNGGRGEQYRGRGRGYGRFDPGRGRGGRIGRNGGRHRGGREIRAERDGYQGENLA